MNSSSTLDEWKNPQNESDNEATDSNAASRRFSTRQIIKHIFPDPQERKQQLAKTTTLFTNTINDTFVNNHKEFTQQMLAAGIPMSEHQRILNKVKLDAQSKAFELLEQNLAAIQQGKLNKS